MHIAEFVEQAHGASRDSGWWNHTTDGGAPLSINDQVPAKIALIHSEVSEALEGHRKDLMDDKLPERKMIEVELADAMIRIADLAGAMGMDLEGAIIEKMAFNAQRADHKPENRAKEGGKKF